MITENINRRIQNSRRAVKDIIPVAVDEVGTPTIMASLTIMAALIPMAFVSGLMGPYMSPIPINASAGMVLSQIVAFVVAPWLAFRLLKHKKGSRPPKPRRLPAPLMALAPCPCEFSGLCSVRSWAIIPGGVVCWHWAWWG